MEPIKMDTKQLNQTVGETPTAPLQAELARLERLSQLLDSVNLGLRLKYGRAASPEFPYPYSAKRVATYQAELSQQPVVSLCPECGGTGYIKLGDFPVSHPDFGKIQHCPTCNLEHRAKWLAKHCGLDPFEQDLGKLST